MEVFGILFAIPVIFVGSIVYCRLATAIFENDRSLARWLRGITWIVVPMLIGEIILLVRFGAQHVHARLGSAFLASHLLVFVLGAPAVANSTILALKHMRCPTFVQVALGAVACFISGVCLL